jgi:hypothetical protein
MSLPVHVTSGRLAIVPVRARFATFAVHVLPVLVFAAMRWYGALGADV